MLAGIQKSITKVRAFASRDASANLAFVPAASQDTQYLWRKRRTKRTKTPDNFFTVGDDLVKTPT
jgi:hypothetical protein